MNQRMSRQFTVLLAGLLLAVAAGPGAAQAAGSIPGKPWRAGNIPQTPWRHAAIADAVEGISTSPGYPGRAVDAAVPRSPQPADSPWQPASSLESIAETSPDLNTAAGEGCPILSRDGRQLYIASNRPGGLGELDIWVAERGPQDAFGAPTNLGAPINSTGNDFCPSPLPDGRGFMFVSNRAGGCGGSDIYITRYHPKNGWAAPVNLGCEVNSAGDEAGPVLVFAESGPPVLYFSSTRPGGPGGSNLYRSRKLHGWSFAAPELVPGVNSDADDQQPYVRHDGRELVFASNRPGSQGFDIWSADRGSPHEEWSEPVNLGPNVNSDGNETRPSLSWDGRTLLFGSTRPGVEGAADIFYSTRD